MTSLKTIALFLDFALGIFAIALGVLLQKSASKNALFMGDEYALFYPSKTPSLLHKVVATILMPIAILVVPILFVLLLIPGFSRAVGRLLNLLGGYGLMQNVLLTRSSLGMPTRSIESAWDGIGKWLG